MQHVLQSLSNLASSFPSVLLKAGKGPLEALQALEQGRGIIAGLILDARSDTSQLKEENLELYNKYKKYEEQITSLRIDYTSSIEIDSQHSYVAKT